jgi:hypothetical protein
MKTTVSNNSNITVLVFNATIDIDDGTYTTKFESLSLFFFSVGYKYY